MIVIVAKSVLETADRIIIQKSEIVLKNDSSKELIVATRTHDTSVGTFMSDVIIEGSYIPLCRMVVGLASELHKKLPKED